MPIYAYKCESCGHAADVMQKMSDDALTQCPACGASTYAKQVTAPNFALKGSGWYVTDFRGGAKPGEAAPAGATAESSGTDKASADKAGNSVEPKSNENTPASTKTPAPVAATPATTPSAPASPPASPTSST